MSAVSKMLTPASRQRPMRRLASSTPVDPQALKNSVPPPNVPVPKQNAETLSPESPSSLYSIKRLLVCNPFRPDLNYVSWKNNHGDHGERGDKLGRAMTIHFLFPVLPVLPVVLTVHAIANCYKSSHSA